MKKISKQEWDGMSNDEVIEFWNEHNYATARHNRGRVPGWGFSSMEALDNFHNCEHQMTERGLLN